MTSERTICIANTLLTHRVPAGSLAEPRSPGLRSESQPPEVRVGPSGGCPVPPPCLSSRRCLPRLRREFSAARPHPQPGGLPAADSRPPTPGHRAPSHSQLGAPSGRAGAQPARRRGPKLASLWV